MYNNPSQFVPICHIMSFLVVIDDTILIATPPFVNYTRHSHFSLENNLFDVIHLTERFNFRVLFINVEQESNHVQDRDRYRYPSDRLDII